MFLSLPAVFKSVPAVLVWYCCFSLYLLQVVVFRLHFRVISGDHASCISLTWPQRLECTPRSHVEVNQLPNG